MSQHLTLEVRLPDDQQDGYSASLTFSDPDDSTQRRALELALQTIDRKMEADDA